MGFSSTKYQKKREERPWKVHPIWRGIGCLLVILIPIMSWAGATLFMDNNRWLTLPKELLQPVAISYTEVAQLDSLIAGVNGLLNGVVYGDVFFFVVFLFIGFGIMSILYAAIYRFIGPPRYSALDSKPIPAPKRRRY